MTMPYQTIICTDYAHIHVDECGAAERFIGCRLLPLHSEDGKLRPEQIMPALSAVGVEHHSQPGVVSVTQCTEVGTVYTAEELKKLAQFSHANNLLVHMDGARIANAAAYLGTSLKAITADVGIDVLSFGGTKNGLMFGEAVVFFSRKLAQNYKYIRKQGTQLASKMRYIAVQFDVLLSSRLWLENAVKPMPWRHCWQERRRKYPELPLHSLWRPTVCLFLCPRLPPKDCSSAASSTPGTRKRVNTAG